MRGNVVATLALTSVFATTDASAFCRTTTERSPADYDSSANGCWPIGLPLFHRSSCVPYRLLVKDSPIIPNAIISDALARGFAAWTAPNAKCTPGITGIELAPINASPIVEYTPATPSNNIVAVAEGRWRFGPQVQALTTAAFNAETGEILGIDVELNPEIAWSFTDPVAPGTFDFRGAMTHEVGHMLGIAHSDQRDTAMFARADPGDVSHRVLAEDDITAVCTIYPNRGQRLAPTGLVSATPCNLAPGRGCGDPDISHGCTTVAPQRTGHVEVAFVAIVLGTIARRRRAEVRPRARAA